MLMSEAIILGSTLAPQVFGITRSRFGTCAIAAAGDAVGWRFKNTIMAQEVWPGLATPARNTHQPTVRLAILWRSDILGWTRQRIAQWLVDSGNDFEVTPRLPENATVCEAETHAGGEIAVIT